MAERIHFPKRILKESKRGFRGYPIATISFYGPNDHIASKAVVGVVTSENGELSALERWWSEDTDIRNNVEIGEQILRFIEGFDVKSVVMTDGIIGCPHEEGTDYEGPTCPMCPFWENRDRWSGEIVH